MTTYPRAKLTVSDVKSIRKRYDPGVVSYAKLAAEYGVTKATIAGIITGRTWTGIDDDSNEGGE